MVSLFGSIANRRMALIAIGGFKLVSPALRLAPESPLLCDLDKSFSGTPHI
jgi:acetyl esterase/lipase